MDGILKVVFETRLLFLEVQFGTMKDPMSGHSFRLFSTLEVGLNPPLLVLKSHSVFMADRKKCEASGTI